MIDPGIVAIAAVVVTLLLGVLTPLFTLLDSRARARRENAQRRNEAYIELLRIVERRGLAVEDQAYNLTEASFDARDPIKVQQRPLSLPPRSDRAEARALAGSHGTPAIRRDLAAWLVAVDAWEAKVTNWLWDIDNIGPSVRSTDEAEPEVSAERKAREQLSATVGAAIAADA